MPASQPHYLLTAETRDRQQWHVVLRSADGVEHFEAADQEPAADGERLELLAVVRGLEALDQPSHVTLLTASRYVHRGLTYGLDEWRSSGWCWERYGAMAPVRNGDLWRRIDRALNVHHVERKPVAVRPASQDPSPVEGRGRRGFRSARATGRKVCAGGAEFAA